MLGLAASVLVGVLHVHHEPSHDSNAPFERVLEAAHRIQLDFVVLTEHAPRDATSGLHPAAERAGVYPAASGRELMVLVGVEYATRDGHLLAYGLDAMVPANGRSGRAAIALIQAAGGFAVVPHPFSHGGWRAWDAPFDGLEVHNNASAIRAMALWSVPWQYLRATFNPAASLKAVLLRDQRALDRWDELLASGRPVVGLSGSDAHEGVRVLGRTLDPYEVFMGAVTTHCPVSELVVDALWAALRAGDCWIRYAVFENRRSEAVEVQLPSGRRELQLDDGKRVLELRNPILRVDGERRSSQ